jgi:hypothetical protein
LRRLTGAPGLVACAILLWGCAEPSGPSIADQVSADFVSPPPMSSKARAVCVDQGGTVRDLGIFGTPTCVLPYADAGRPCTGDTDCLGQCRLDGAETDPPPAVGAEVKGRCQVDTDDFGCYTTVEGGKAELTICVD